MSYAAFMTHGSCRLRLMSGVFLFRRHNLSIRVMFIALYDRYVMGFGLMHK